MTPLLSRLGRRVFAALLRALPGQFRGDFSDAIRGDLDAMAAPRWWTREIPGLAAAILREWSDGTRHDATYSLRQLARTPGFTTAAIVMLAVGTGATAAVVSVVDAAIVRPSFPDADRVVNVSVDRPDGSHDYELPVASVDTLKNARALAAVAAVTGRYTVLTGGREDRRLLVECISASAFDVIGVRPMIGRAYTADEDTAVQPVIVIGYGLWRKEFGGDRNVVGRTLTLDAKTSTVIGVMPRGFVGIYAQSDTEAWAPLGPYTGNNAGTCPAASDGIVRRTLGVIARVRPPLSAAQAAVAMRAQGLVPDGIVQLEPTYGLSYDAFHGPLIALLWMVVCTLAIACANVANLQLGRLTARKRELQIRIAMGATRARIVRQTMIENLLLAFAGAAAGLPAAQLTLRAIASMMPPTIPNVDDLAIDGRVVAVMVAGTMIAGLLVGLLPSVYTLRERGRSSMLRSRGVAGGALGVRRVLVISEVSLSVALLVGAGLMVRTFLALRSSDLGFTAENRATARTLLPDGWTPAPGHRQFMDDVVRRLSALPGVERAAGSSYLPLSGRTAVSQVWTNGAKIGAWSAWTTPGFLADMGMQVTRGRQFSAGDGPGATPVAIINEELAARLFPDSDALGRVIDVRPQSGVVTRRTVVGILRNVRQSGRDLKQWPEVYVPYAQEPGPALLYFVVKTAGPVNAHLLTQIQAAVRDVRPGQTVERLEPMEASVDRAFARPRFGAWLFGALAVIAAGLATFGLGAVITRWVAERRREIGVRMALGATRSTVVNLVVRQAVVLTIVGTIIGTGVAGACTHLLSRWLYGVTPTDPWTFGASAAAMLLAASAAAFLPARRAARVDPAITLRTE
jgi:putative ABC transport system permease protein